MSRPRNRPETVGEWMTAGLGLGLLRPAPGTWGSLPPVVIACALALLHTDPRVIDMTLAAIGLVFGLSCLAFGERAEARFGKKDPGAVVADELAGQSLALMWLPWSGGNERIIATAAIAFFAFRLFDIVKPPPARGWQRFPAGFGILIDDLVAGLYALVATQVLVRILW